jgi:hypothetical protein
MYVAAIKMTHKWLYQFTNWCPLCGLGIASCVCPLVCRVHIDKANHYPLDYVECYKCELCGSKRMVLKRSVSPENIDEWWLLSGGWIKMPARIKAKLSCKNLAMAKALR